MYFGTSDVNSDDENGNGIYSYTAVFEMDSYWAPYFAKVKVVPVLSEKRKLRSQEIEVEYLNEETVRPHLERIPLSEVYLRVPKTFLRAKIAHSEIAMLDPWTCLLTEHLQLSTRSAAAGREKTDVVTLFSLKRQSLEVFRKSPHPNILQYDGCVVRNGRIVALAVPKLRETLRDRIVEDQRPIDGRKIYSEISSAIHHIHSLGFAHNDLSSRNIMLNNNGTAILIDFDTCARERTVLPKIPGATW